MNENLLPVGGGVVPAEIGLHLAREDFERGGLSDAVGAHEAEDLAGARHGESVEFEGVGSVSVGGVAFEVLGEVDDVDGLEGTFLDADAAADAERLGEVGDFGLGAHFDAQLAEFDHGAGLFAFLTAFLGFASFAGYDGDTAERVGLVVRLDALLLGRHFGCSVG